jgi:hypothetical protein
MRRQATNAVGVLLVALATPACGLGAPPPDATMIAHFQRERPAFEEIVRMMTEDARVGNLVLDDQPGDAPPQRARRARYRALVRRTGVRWVGRDASGRITLNYPYPMSGGGVAGTGFKEYVYAPTPPSPLRRALDDGGHLKRFEDTFRHIEGRWYLSRMRI